MWPSTRKRSTTTTFKSNSVVIDILSIFYPNLQQLLLKKTGTSSKQKSTGNIPRKLMIAFKRNKSLKEIIGLTRIENGKVKKIDISPKTEKCSPSLLETRSLCCKQKITTTTFIS